LRVASALVLTREMQQRHDVPGLRSSTRLQQLTVELTAR
jgi:hypothetical protein